MGILRIPPWGDDEFPGQDDSFAEVIAPKCPKLSNRLMKTALCPCKSGLKYRDCCYPKGREAAEGKVNGKLHFLPPDYSNHPHRCELYEAGG